MRKQNGSPWRLSFTRRRKALRADRRRTSSCEGSNPSLTFLCLAFSLSSNKKGCISPKCVLQIFWVVDRCLALLGVWWAVHRNQCKGGEQHSGSRDRVGQVSQFSLHEVQRWFDHGKSVRKHKSTRFFLFCRMLRTNEDIEVKSVGLKLQDMKAEEKKKSSPCCNWSQNFEGRAQSGQWFYCWTALLSFSSVFVWLFLEA